jgi:hypothetical protein
MDTTATFSNRSNAKRAAEKMIANGTAPAVDYGFKTRDDGRFEIVWQTAAAAGDADPFARIRASEEIQALGTTPEKYAKFDPAAEALAVHKDWLAEQAALDTATGTEIATASSTAGESAASGEPAPVTTEPQPEPDPFPAGTYVKVQTGKRKIRTGHIASRIDPQHWRVRLLGAADGVTELASAAQLYLAEGEAPTPEVAKPARWQRGGAATGPQKASRSRYAIDAEAIASGKLPATAPVVTSAANPHYQKKFDALHAHAVAGEWDAVRDYKVTGSNSYSKMVERYRQDLLAVHKATAEATRPR